MVTSSYETTDLAYEATTATPYPVPSMVDEAKNAMVEAPELEDLANDLAVTTLGDVRWYWKNSESGDWTNPKLGAIALVPPLFRPTFGATYVAWVSAPWVVAFNMTRQQVEAEVFHLLCHVADDDNERPIIQKPSVVAFPEELARYGAWSSALHEGWRKVQPMLPGMED